MSRIRLLFAAESVAVAERISAALAASGYDAGPETGPASAALVIWSPDARQDPAILAAARSALARRVLIPAALGKSPPPASFEHLWPMDLSGWDGSESDPRWRFVLDEIELALRRDVVFGDVADAAPAPERASLRAEREFADTLQGVYAEERYEAMSAPRPRLPFAAMLAGFIFLGVAAGGAFLFGRQSTQAAPEDGSLPVIAYLEPSDRYAGAEIIPDTDKAALPAEEAAVEDAAPAEGALALAPPEEPVAQKEENRPEETPLREPAPAASVSLAALETIAPQTEDVPAPAASPAPQSAEETPAPPEKVDVIASLALEAGAAAEAGAAVEPEAAPADAGLYFRDCISCPDMAEIHPEPGALSGYAIGVQEITNAQWKSCVEDAACPAAPDGAAGSPVLKISYAEALRYVAWLSAKTGRSYRLPGETEWNVAAAGDAGADRNSFGVKGLAGGVWEWTMACAGDPCDRRFVRGGEFNPSTGGGRNAAAIDERRANVGFRVARDLP